MANVLIVDDDASGAGALAALLRREGHETVLAENAGAALSQLRRREPDLVLLDLSMPRVDGLFLLDALTDEPRFEDLRVIVYSGRNEPEDLAAARRLGALDYIVKGEHNWESIYERIRHALPDAETLAGA